MKKLMYVFLLAFFSVTFAHSDSDFPPATSALSPKPKEIPDKATQFCFAYIKGLKAIFYDIYTKGINQTMLDHPPADEGVEYEFAMALAKEIKTVIDEEKPPQEWIEMKWKSCMADPYSVGKR